jgi:DNA-binding Lrp family transcriptional regulator
MALKKASPPGARQDAQNKAAGHGWTFLSNHSHVLICLAQDPEQRLRDVAVAVGITERAVQKIVQELEQGGVLTRQRVGRRNRYELHTDLPLRHPIEAHRTVGHLLGAVIGVTVTGTAHTRQPNG